MATETDDSRAIGEREGCVLGCAKVSLEHLCFEHQDVRGTRAVTQGNVRLLMSRFETDKCRRDEPSHWIPAVVTPDQLRVFLDYNRLGQLTQAPADLRLHPDWTVTCLQGRVRKAAGSEWLDTNDRWWVVKFYDATRISNNARRSLREYRDVSQEHTSGEIYRNIRLYQRDGREAEAREWLARWHPHARRDFKQLWRGAKYRLLREALDALLDFDGLWSCHLNLHRLLPMRCPEVSLLEPSEVLLLTDEQEQANYLNYIRDWCNHVVGGTPWALDASTVQRLEGRAPRWSTDDREYVDEVYADGLLFSKVTDSQTKAIIYQRVINTPSSIPSLHTFHEDIKYLEPMAKLVRTLLPRKYRGSIQEGMKRRYQAPADNNFYIQTSASDHRREPSASSYGFWSAYRQVFLAGMRDFYPLVPGFAPLKMYKVPLAMLSQLEAPAVLLDCFIELARSVGFAFPNSRPREILLQPAIYRQPMLREPNIATQHDSRPAARQQREGGRPSLTMDADEEWSLGARCGMTDGMSFFSDREYLYLDNIYTVPRDSPRQCLTSFAVKRDFFLAFFPAFLHPRRTEEQGGPSTAPQSRNATTQGQLPAPPNSGATAGGQEPGVSLPQPPRAGETSAAQPNPNSEATETAARTTTDSNVEMVTPPGDGPSSPQEVEMGDGQQQHTNGRRAGRPNRIQKEIKRRNKWQTVLRRQRAGVVTVQPSSSNAQTTSAATGPSIMQQNSKWCNVQVNGAPGQFVKSLIEQLPSMSVCCLLNLPENIATYISTAHINDFQEVVPIQPGPWFAQVLEGGILSIIPVTEVISILRDKKLVVMGCNGNFHQQALLSDFRGSADVIDIPSFSVYSKSWEFEL